MTEITDSPNFIELPSFDQVREKMKDEEEAYQDSVSSQKRNGDFVRHFLPDTINDKDIKNGTFFELSQIRDSSGNPVGINILKKAWQNAMTYANTRAAIDDTYKKVALDLAMLSSGTGTADNQFQNFMTGFDKYHTAKLPPYLEMSGPTFITRPRLCLQSSNIRNSEMMLPLDTVNPASVAFAIRYLLDTNLTSAPSNKQSLYQTAAKNCPLINPQSPWFIPLCNSITDISGFPDIAMNTDTTAGGYYMEAQKFATGYNDFSNASNDLNLSFREMPGGVISAIFMYWLEYIRCVTRGIMLAYPDDIDGLIINYTVSIYQFNMDPSYQYITRWCKCTGCFPLNLDLGSIFSKSEKQYYQDASQKVTVRFACNKFEYMKPSILMDFNTLAMRYFPEINKTNTGRQAGTDENGSTVDIIGADPNSGDLMTTPNSRLSHRNIPYSPFANYCGLPFIMSDPNGYRLVYRESDKDLSMDPVVQRLISFDVASAIKAWENADSATNRYKEYINYTYKQYYDESVKKMQTDNPNLSFEKIVNDIIENKYKS